jgi:phosphohistidine phosphatase
VIEVAELQPGHKPREVLRALAPYAAHASVALVGHEPGLGELTALLVGFRSAPEFKKGGVARVDVALLPPPAGSGTIAWWLTPKLLRALGG